MMQSFYLEHDGIDSFLKVVKSVVETMFSLKSNQYSQLYLTTHKNCMFRDGKKWIGNDQDLLNKLGVNALSASDERGWSKPTRFFICTIADYKNDMDNDNEAISFNNYSTLISRLKKLLKDDPNQKISKQNQFFKTCGQGYTYGFNENDGDIDMGYCCQFRPMGGWNSLDISLCHMYYVK